MQVRVYRNLSKGCWSVLAKQTGGWRLHHHADSIILENVAWTVSQAGRRRVLKQKRKNVHAFAEGTTSSLRQPLNATRQVIYNPYNSPFFHWKTPTFTPVFYSQFVQFNADGSVMASEL